ncbi:MAG: hypothetical protein EHM20_00140 [Alphaproteobacteria bacterium]|nr:MAG: hypothetical protein EHM20_00140 [Alphaproteobacteria bacterium]
MVVIDLEKDEVSKFLKASEAQELEDLIKDETNILLSKMFFINEKDINVSAKVFKNDDSCNFDSFEVFATTAKVSLNDYKAQLRKELNKHVKLPAKEIENNEKV